MNSRLAAWSIGGLAAAGVVVLLCAFKQAAVAQTETPGSAKSTAIESGGAPQMGTWILSRQNVQVGLLRVVPATGYADFALYVTRGSPDFISGAAVGRMLAKDGRWAYETTAYGPR